MNAFVYASLSLAAVFAGLAAMIWSVWTRRAPGVNPVQKLLAERYPPDPERWSQVAVGLLLGLISVLVPVGIMSLLGWVHIFWSGWRTLPLFLLALASIGIKLLWVVFEELIFRGALQPALAAWLPRAAALILAALLFAFGHLSRQELPNLLSLAVLFLDGLGFGLVFLATGGLWMAAAWHFGKNLLVWLVYDQGTLQFAPGLLRAGFTGPELWVGAAGQAGLLDVLTSLGLVLIAVWIFLSSSSNGSSSGSSGSQSQTG